MKYRRKALKEAGAPRLARTTMMHQLKDLHHFRRRQVLLISVYGEGI